MEWCQSAVFVSRVHRENNQMNAVLGHSFSEVITLPVAVSC